MPCSRTSTPERGACSCAGDRRRRKCDGDVVAKFYWRRMLRFLRSAVRGRSTVELSSSALPGGEATLPELEPGSFRDPDSRVVTTDGRVLRLLSGEGSHDWEALAQVAALRGARRCGKLVATREVEPEIPAGTLASEVAAVLEHAARALRVLPVRVRCSGCCETRPSLRRARAPVDRGGDDPEGLVAATSSSTAPGCCSTTSAPSSRCGRASPGPGTGSSGHALPLPAPSESWKGAVPALVAREPRGDHARDVPLPALSGATSQRRGAVTHVALHARLERSHQATRGRSRGTCARRASGRS